MFWGVPCSAALYCMVGFQVLKSDPTKEFISDISLVYQESSSSATPNPRRLENPLVPYETRQYNK